MSPELQGLIDYFKEYLVLLSAWFAIVAYVWSLGRQAWERLATQGPRFLYTLGFAFFLIHVVGAFSVHHEWSHSQAATHTGQTSLTRTGYSAPWGIWVNYFFGLVWLVDLIAWYRFGEQHYRSRQPRIVGIHHGFFLLMVFFGAFFFADSPQAWAGLAISIFGMIALIQLIYRKPAEALV